jgi:hypothetical protein
MLAVRDSQLLRPAASMKPIGETSSVMSFTREVSGLLNLDSASFRLDLVW